MPQYLSPGVYVEEVPSAVRPIAGVSTSTACFLGIVPDTIHIPEENPKYDPTGKSTEADSKEAYKPRDFRHFTPEEWQARKDAVDAAKKALADNKDAKKTDELRKTLHAAE